MKKIKVSDITMREYSKNDGHILSFREKVEMAKLMDKLNYESIELPVIKNEKTDTLFVKTVASILKNSALVCRVGEDVKSVEVAYNAIKEAKAPILQVALPVSTVQMEYFLHKKPAMMLEMLKELVSKCKEYVKDVEFVAMDACRSDVEFLYEVLNVAISSGANKITLCDSAGIMLAEEFESFINEAYKNVAGLKDVEVAVEINNKLNMAEACAFSAIKVGVSEIKTIVCGKEYGTVEGICELIKAKGSIIDADCEIKTTDIKRTVNQLMWLMQTTRSDNSPFDMGVGEENVLSFSKNDSVEVIAKAVEKMGYDLADEDIEQVYGAFKQIADKKEMVSSKELELIVASNALQVPPTFVLESFVINSGNIINATANITIKKMGVAMQGVCVGDGPIDAAFLAIEQISGVHYELDDFQIQAVSEGREAMGSALVKLRASSGKVYSGNGLSTDIVGASIMAYVSALNKIAYEEENK